MGHGHRRWPERRRYRLTSRRHARELAAGLREPGLTFLLAAWQVYGDWRPAHLILLRQAAEVVDALENYRTRLAADGHLDSK